MEETKNSSAVYRRENTVREPMIMLVCGETGVGKTYRNKMEIESYMRDNPLIGKKGRKVLAFDTNDDDYTAFQTVNPDYIRALSRVAPRRIRPYNKDGSPMDAIQKKEVVHKIVTFFTGGMLVLDDIDHYMVGAKGQSMIGALCTVRHKGIDVLLTHQSIAKITTSEWQNCTWLRLHHQVDEITKYKERIPKYAMVRIAQLIVDEQYDLAAKAYAEGRLSKAAYAVQKSFFLYINMREQKIVGCSRAAFIRSAKRYIDQEENRKVRMYLQERGFNGKPVYKNRNEVVVKLILDYLRYHQAKMDTTLTGYGTVL